MNIFPIRYPYILLTIFLSFAFSSFSQNNIESNCGTVTTFESQKYFNTIKPQIKKFEQEFMLKKTSRSKSIKEINSIPLKIHIIRTSDGSGGLNDSDLNNAIANLNAIYTDALIDFYIYEDIDYIDNNRFCHFKKGDEKSLFKTNFVPGIINIYFTDIVLNNSGENICGYSDDKEKNNIIILKNSCATNNSSFAHEMGHQFSLVHTHGPNNGMTTEFVDGSNCDTDGDGICDTPADPRLSSNVIDNFCGYMGNETDAHGDIFKPDTGNIMSYSRKACRDHFTPQQLTRINAYFKFAKDRFLLPKNNIESADLKALKIYPNPITNGIINIKSYNPDDVLKYTFTNIYGQVIKTGIVTNQPINVSNLSFGTYLLTIDNGSSKIVKRVIK